MNSQVNTEEIFRYELYGEASSTEDPEFIHIETIQARSRLHNWQIKPHTHHRMFQIVFILRGEAELYLDNYQTRLTGPCSVTIPSGVVHGFEMTPKTAGYVVTVSELLLVDARYRRSRKMFEPLYREPYVINFKENSEDCAPVRQTLEQMKREFLRPRMGRDSMFEWLLRILLMSIRREMERTMAPAATNAAHQGVFANFYNLLEENYRQHWGVEQYADALAMSQARLNRLCHSVENRSANEIIQDRIILEAQRNLIYSTASVALIAYDLGYKDPAYFSRFFKRRTGMTPGQFRKQRQKD